MPKTLSSEMRKLIEVKYDQGKTYGEIANELNLKYRTVQGVVQAKKYYSIPGNERKRRGATAKINDECRRFIQSLIDADCCITLREIRTKLQDTSQLSVSIQTIL